MNCVSNFLTNCIYLIFIKVLSPLFMGNVSFRQNCTYSNCYTTSDKTYLPVEQFDAILFHGVEYRKETYSKPSKRKPEQIYITSIQESPDNTPQFYRDYNNFYNWTMSYRQDSDLIRPYGVIVQQKTDYQPPTTDEIKRRPKMIAWFVSNCVTDSRREHLYNNLKQFVNIDVYGSCGNFTCFKNESEDCYQMVENNYKFYLSFENSYCKDYVTEKLFYLLKFNIVPIVYGGANYNEIAPKHSVINVNDFDSVKHLVDYLNFLSDNPEKYLKYFEWKQNYIVDTSSNSVICQMCQKLNEVIYEKVYTEIGNWWFGVNSDICNIPKKMYNLLYHSLLKNE